MPIVHTNRHNSEIKKYLRCHRISYTELADASGYSKGTIDQWMIHPLTTARRDIITQAIEKIIKKRPAPAEYVEEGYNYQLRKRLIEEHISYTELGKQLGKSQSCVWNDLNKAELSSTKKAMYISVIDDIVAERRSLHED